MSKFSSKQRRANVTAPVRSKSTRPDLLTYEGGAGYSRDSKSELFLLAIANMVGEDTFYEPKDERDARFHNLIHAVTTEDPNWVRGFIPFLRGTMNMRSASVVAAAEYVAAGGEKGRDVVSSALQRPDEPAEMLAYWHYMHGRNEPKPLKRGVADAVQRLYTEFAALKYDGKGRAWRMGDVIERVHPSPSAPWQSTLFRHLLDTRHDHPDYAIPKELAVLTGVADWIADGAQLPPNGEQLPSGVTWEMLSTYHKMDSDAWKAVIPHMGYMALLRNLRNFEQAEIPETLLNDIAFKLSKPEEVAKSKQFPFRFMSAYKAIDSLTFAPALEKALDLSLQNVPELPGHTLILVDVSGSMFSPVSMKSKMEMWEIAGLFGFALAKRAERADLFAYSNQAHQVAFTRHSSTLRAVDAMRNWPGAGGGTQTFHTLRGTYKGHDRVVILTDEQAFAYGYQNSGDPTIDEIPLIYTWNLNGYRAGHLPSGEKGRYTFGGLTDAAFLTIPLIEASTHATWPWE